MRVLTVRNAARDVLLGSEIGLANRMWTRLLGLLGRADLSQGEGLLITPCRGVHMYGMRFPIDVALLDAKRQVIAIYPNLRPGQRTRVHRSARFALELPAGTLGRTGTERGHRLDWEAE